MSPLSFTGTDLGAVNHIPASVCGALSVGTEKDRRWDGKGGFVGVFGAVGLC